MRRSSLGFGVTALAMLAGLTLSVECARAQDVPFQARVVADKVEVLAGGSRTFYVVGRLNTGAVVSVREVIEGYHRISPPTGVYSYVSKAFVDAKGDGKSGVVSADRAKVVAASVNGPGESYRWQVDLLKGAVVQIVAEEGSYYKIVPPEGTSVYLPPNAVRRVEAPAPVAKPEPATGALPPEVKPGAPVKPLNVEARPAEATKPAPKPVAATKPAEAPKPVAVAKPVEAPKAVEATKPVEAPKPVAAIPATPATPATPAAPEAPATPAAPAAEPAMAATPVAPAAPTTPPAVTADARPVTPPAATTAPSATVRPTPTPPTPTPAVVAKPVEPPAAPKPPAPAFVPARAVTPAVQALEQRLGGAQSLPLEKQPLAEILAGYEAAAAAPNLPLADRRIVMTRTAQLKRSIEIQGALTSLSQVGAAASGAITMPQGLSSGPGVYRPAKYDIVGQLLASGVYDGDAGPRLYRVVEPGTMRTIAYVQQGKFDPTKTLGRIVGINGALRYDPALKLNVIEVARLEPLEAAATPPATPPATTPTAPPATTQPNP